MRKPGSSRVPDKAKTYSSKVSGRLQVTYGQGRKVLNADAVNYSYGALQQVLHEGLRKIGFNDSFKNILVLGMGGGCIVETLRKDFGSSAKITLVEIDPAVIAIAENEFDISSYSNIEIIETDALDFVRETGEQYDLVVVDVFIRDSIPVEFTETEFLTQLAQLLKPGGKLLYNSLRTTLEKDVLDRMTSSLTALGIKIESVQRVGQANDLILGEKSTPDK